MNTPIQEAIERINVKIKHFEGKDGLTLRERGMQDAYINSVKILESLVQDEQKSFIDYGVDCQLGQNCNQDTIVNAIHKAVDIFDDTFSKS